MQNERDVAFTPEIGADRLNQTADRSGQGRSGGMEEGSAVTGRSNLQTGEGPFAGQPGGVAEPFSPGRVGNAGAANTPPFEGSSGRAGSTLPSGDFDNTTRLGPQGDGSRPNDWSHASSVETGSDRFGGDTMGQTEPNRLQQVRDAAGDIGHRAAERLQERISEQKHRTTDTLEGVAQSLRTAGQQLPPENGMSRYIIQAANQVDNLAAFLNNRDVEDLLHDVEGFARRQPAVFVGGAFALGVLGARFLKSSQRNTARYDEGDYLDRGGYSQGGFRPPVEPTGFSDAGGFGRPGQAGRAGYDTGGFT